MPITNADLNKTQKERQDLIRKLDKNPIDEDLKRRLKNANERIRVNTKKLEVETSKPVGRPPIQFELTEKGKKATKKLTQKAILEAEFEKGNLDVRKLVEKHGFKPKNVSWYKSQWKNK